MTKTKAKSKAKRSGKQAKAKSPNGRLGPGELDGLVLSYMRKRKNDGPLTPSAIGKGIKRSSGAVANCLVRLGRAKKVRQTKQKPRSYVLEEAK